MNICESEFLSDVVFYLCDGAPEVIQRLHRN